MASCESLYGHDTVASTSTSISDSKDLEAPIHMKHVASYTYLADPEQDRDEASWSSVSPSVEAEGSDIAILEHCVDDISCATVHLQELLSEDLVFSSTECEEAETNRHAPIAPSSERKGTKIQRYLLWGRLSGPFLLFSLVGLVLIFFARSHLLQLLRFLQNLAWLESIVVFIFLFTLVSFPFGFGYIILNLMAGYLYGVVKGQVVVVVSVAIGFTISFLLCRVWLQEYARRTITSHALQAIMRVVEGRSGMKVILLTRLTPIPFGLQNVLFAVSVHGVCVFIIKKNHYRPRTHNYERSCLHLYLKYVVHLGVSSSAHNCVCVIDGGNSRQQLEYYYFYF